MRNILNFLMGYSSKIAFVFYVVMACWLLFHNNPYQQHVYMTSAGKLASMVYEQSNAVSSYFNLRDINEDLQRRNASLEAEVIGLRNQMRAYQELYYADTMQVIQPLQPYSFIIAHVINNSINRPFNYITIEKGEADGVKRDMGVVDQNGVVGVVNLVGEHSARIISLLNPNWPLSAKVKGTDGFGTVVWDGKSHDEAIIKELPKHTQWRAGDTIVTSGYSGSFPEGIPVGVVLGRDKKSQDNFYTLRIRLLTDFSQLSTVRVIVNSLQDEINRVETEDLPDESPIL